MQLKKVIKKNNPDLIFFIKAENITYKTITRIKQNTTCKLINFYPDNPFSFWNGNSNSNVLLSLPFYDHFLIWSKQLIPILASAGCKQVSYFPFAYDETIFKTTVTINPSDKKKYTADVCFIGTWDAERETWLSKLKELAPAINLAIWGNGWEPAIKRHPSLQHCLKGPAIYGPEIIKAFNFSSIVLNFIRKQNLEGHNMRTFEVLASGAFMLTQRTKEQTEYPFQEDFNVACFSTPEELTQKIMYYLCNLEERMIIAQQGNTLAQQFTLTEQLKKIFATEGNLT